MSLIIVITNNGSGPDDAANYNYEVRVNQGILEYGHIYNHDRRDGWKKLVQMMLDEGDPYETIPDHVFRKVSELIKKGAGK